MLRVSATGMGLVAAGLPESSLLLAAPKAAGGDSPTKSPPGRWYEHAWRRAVIDMHIPDWDEKFLSQFDADQYVERLLQSRAQSVVCYAQSHVGLFNYPTKVGQHHRGLKGRDIVAEMVERCRQHNIAIQLYSSLIHDRWAFDQHPDWRMTRHDGSEFGAGSRYGVVCPNSGYREYVRAWVREMAERFDVEGFRFDMTFWVGVCYCDNCQARWAKEVGGDMPRKVDWTDPRWVTLQHKPRGMVGRLRGDLDRHGQAGPPGGERGTSGVDLSAQLDFRRFASAGRPERFLAGRFLRRPVAGLVRPQAAQRTDAPPTPLAMKRVFRWSCAIIRAASRRRFWKPRRPPPSPTTERSSSSTPSIRSAR